MSIRAVELQVAIPRTADASTAQNQLSQKPVHDQSLLAGQMKKQADEARKKSVKVDETMQLAIKDDEQGNSGEQTGHESSKKRKSAAGNKMGPSDHPFKGKHIDITL